MPRSKRNLVVHSFFENWFVPMVFGVVVVAVVVQVIGTNPTVRTAMDRVEGRFVNVSAINSVPPGLANATAVITLTASSINPSGIEVLRNGTSLGDFISNQMRVTVHEGDKLEFVDLDGSNVSITVDTNSPDILHPASGQVVLMNSKNRHASLSNVEFI